MTEPRRTPCSFVDPPFSLPSCLHLLYRLLPLSLPPSSPAQGKTAGYGSRGQKSRSGRGPRPGFEGGQTPAYRRLPKLKGIAGGNAAGLPDFVCVNLDALEQHFAANEEVTLAALEAKGVLNATGRDASLPLKVLGTGELSKPLVVKAAAFSAAASEKIAKAGGKTEAIAAKPSWSRKAYEAMKKEMAAKGLDIKVEMAKRRAAKAKAKVAAAATAAKSS